MRLLWHCIGAAGIDESELKALAQAREIMVNITVDRIIPIQPYSPNMYKAYPIAHRLIQMEFSA